MYIYVLLIFNFLIYKYLYNNYFKTSEQLNRYQNLKEILDKVFTIPGNFNVK